MFFMSKNHCLARPGPDQRFGKPPYSVACPASKQDSKGSA